MTTIVVDQSMNYMAADFMATSNDGEYVMKCGSKIVEVDIGGDQYLVGLAGLEGPGLIFLDWFEYGDWDEPPESMESMDEADDFSAVVLGSNGIQIADKFMRLTPVENRWYAAGTGGPIAWAILYAGCGIVKAMESALRLDAGSGFGFEVKYLNGRHEDYSE
jgi:hypothetical protein